MRRSAALLPAAILLSLTVVLAACTSSSAPASPTAQPTVNPRSLTVGLVTDIGKLSDRSYNHLAYQGILRRARQEGVKYRVLQSNTTKDYVPNLTTFAKAHLGLIIAIGFSMQKAIYQVAASHPDERFAIVDAAPVDRADQQHDLPNVADVFFREQESGYLAGVVAGLVEKHRVGRATHGVIGYMGATPMPSVDHYLAGYVAGALKVDPSLRILGDYSNSFTDIKGGRAVGMRQIQQHADILFGVAADSGLGYLTAARDSGVYGIGVDADESYLGPFILTSAVKRVDVAVEAIIDSITAGAFRGGKYDFGLDRGATGIAPTGTAVPKYIVAAVNSYASKIASGKIIPPTTIPRH